MSSPNKIIKQRLPLFIVTLPAVLWFWSGWNTQLILVYFIGVGMIWTVARIVADSRPSSLRYRLGADPAEARARGLIPLDGLGKTDEDEGFGDRFPDLMPLVTLIRQAIDENADINFRYQLDNDNGKRRATPIFLREVRHHSAKEAALCVNAFYEKRQKKVDFSLSRMSEVEIVDQG